MHLNDETLSDELSHKGVKNLPLTFIRVPNQYSGPLDGQSLLS